MRQAYDYWQDQPGNLRTFNFRIRDRKRIRRLSRVHANYGDTNPVSFPSTSRLFATALYQGKVITKAVVVESINIDNTVKTKDVLPQKQKTYIVTKG